MASRGDPPEYHPGVHGGLELGAMPPQGLEVAQPRPGLSRNGTWEKPSALPEAVGAGGPGNAYDDDHQQKEAVAHHFAPLTPDFDYSGRQQPLPPRVPRGPAPRTRDWRLCGMTRKGLIVVVLLVLFVPVIAIALGVGLGLGLRSSGSSAAASTTTSSQTASATATTTPSTTMSLPSPTATAALGAELNITCASNLTLYQSSGSSSSSGRRRDSTGARTTPTDFLFLCGRDYTAADGAVDIAVVTTGEAAADFAACLVACAAQESCYAASWGPSGGTDTCWLKSELGTVSWSEGWHLGVLDDS